jgi:hypothetical protein
MLKHKNIQTALLLLAALLTAAAAVAAGPGLGRWLGPDGEPLPFTTDEEALEFLRTAEVVESEEIEGSINRPLKLTLERDGVRAHAIFRTVEVERAEMRNVQEHARGFRDSYVFEVAAYELSRLLGIDNVPPATLRTLDGEDGSIQLWIEQAKGVEDRMEEGIAEQHEQLWLFQKQNMVVFDNLIYNFDRNPGNMLIDPYGKVWFVDHTRTFKILPSLADRGHVKVCERKLWEGLRNLDPEEARERLDPYLTRVQIDALLARRDKLVKMIEKKIARHGEQAILFEFVRS